MRPLAVSVDQSVRHGNDQAVRQLYLGQCAQQDQRLVDGIQTGGFSVNYYTSPSSTTANTITNDSSQSDNVRFAALQTASTVSVTINATSTAAGRSVSQSGTIREISPNNVTPVLTASCYSILNTGGSIGDGTYSITPSGTATVQAYCDMTNGGWTRLNNNISSSSTAFNGSDVLITNNVPGSCGSPGCAFTIQNISVPHTNVKILLTRTTSIVQCAGLVGVGGGSSTYWTGSAWANNIGGMCTWSDGIFANATSTDMTNLKLLWKMEGLKAVNGEIKFTSQCSGGDSGQIQVTAWVK